MARSAFIPSKAFTRKGTVPAYNENLPEVHITYAPLNVLDAANHRSRMVKAATASDFKAEHYAMIDLILDRVREWDLAGPDGNPLPLKGKVEVDTGGKELEILSVKECLASHYEPNTIRGIYNYIYDSRSDDAESNGKLFEEHEVP